MIHVFFCLREYKYILSALMAGLLIGIFVGKSTSRHSPAISPETLAQAFELLERRRDVAKSFETLPEKFGTVPLWRDNFNFPAVDFPFVAEFDPVARGMTLSESLFESTIIDAEQLNQSMPDKEGELEDQKAETGNLPADNSEINVIPDLYIHKTRDDNTTDSNPTIGDAP